MAESSPLPKRIIGKRQSYSHAKNSSPKTPTHPSNGYQIMEEEGTDDSNLLPRSSVESSPESLDNFVHLKSNNDGSDAHDMGINKPQTINGHTSLEDCSDNDNEIAAAVSQDDESDDAVVVSQDDERPLSLSEQLSAPVMDTPSKNGGKATASKTEPPSTARRRSRRLQARALEPLTPEKKSSTHREPYSASKDTAMGTLEEESATKQPSASARRRSLRIQGRAQSPALSCVRESAKKSPSKRQSPKKVPSSKKRSRYEKEESELVMDGTESSLPSPKRLMLGMAEGAVDSKLDVKQAVASALPNRFNFEEEEVLVDPTMAKGAVEVSSFEVSMSEKGQIELVQALEKIAFDVVIGPSNFSNVSRRKSRSGRLRKRKSRGAKTSVLETLDSSPAKENILNSSVKKVRPKNRRDTFDLSKKRGLTSAAKRLDDLNVLIDDEMQVEGPNNIDYVTPKAGSAEVNIDAIVGEITRNLDDDPMNIQSQNVRDDIVDSVELSAVMHNLDNLTSIAIEDRMRELFPNKMTHAYKYPCVSPRTFAAMSVVYKDQANFVPLLPFLTSLVDAEIVSLKNLEENEPVFINKKVCFSGFDYSSTTTALGAVVGQGGGDLRPNIVALEAVLLHALKLQHPVHYLDLAIQCLKCMASHADVNEACAKTVVGYFPSARFTKAFNHYLDELKDVKSYVTSQQNAPACDSHIGVRYRLNDFIGRSVRYHLRELLNTLPESVVEFNVDECEERWGRAVDDRSISSILNFSLEKIHELMIVQPAMFDYGSKTIPNFFTREASTRVHTSMTREDLKEMDKATYESLVLDISEARSFLFGARACEFVLNLLQCPGVEDHINDVGGWAAVEAMASTFYNLNLHDGSESEHFVQLRGVRDLIFMLEDVNSQFEQTVEHCEFSIRRLRRKFNFKTKNKLVHNIKLHIAGEKGEKFPVVVPQ
eukprot:CAMPEP_0183702892 /NCGR_PEP_ID=MMETSP0737-20130205/840_1 /TAXON_ID=385413 /ORGANISM="Thalassiosira miniscula, Strain CCMP1093" /LENGTH=937 /DNA_ID=CAMNT_0025929575 /DNA_START=60 /DNA_END=2873 /DNA_ORIENTATION=-